MTESLERLLRTDILEADALTLITDTIALAEQDKKLCLYYPGAFVYTFLVNSRSVVADLIYKHFTPYPGDLLSDSYFAAIDGNRQNANLSSAIRLFVLGVYRDQHRQDRTRGTSVPEARETF